MTIKIILADDHKVVREGLKSLIEKQPGMTVIAEAEDGHKAVELSHKLSPDVVIMDITMPDLNGIEATRQILAENGKVKVIALSMHTDKRFVVEMLKAGASGYLLKTSAFDELANAIRAVAAQKTYLSPQLADAVIKDYANLFPGTALSVYSVLTAREREVLQLLAEGKATGEIAKHLFLSGKTIETHRLAIMKKLGIHSLADLVKYAMREGLVSPEP